MAPFLLFPVVFSEVFRITQHFVQGVQKAVTFLKIEYNNINVCKHMIIQMLTATATSILRSLQRHRPMNGLDENKSSIQTFSQWMYERNNPWLFWRCYSGQHILVTTTIMKNNNIRHSMGCTRVRALFGCSLSQMFLYFIRMLIIPDAACLDLVVNPYLMIKQTQDTVFRALYI